MIRRKNIRAIEPAVTCSTGSVAHSTSRRRHCLWRYVRHWLHVRYQTCLWCGARWSGLMRLHWHPNARLKRSCYLYCRSPSYDHLWFAGCETLGPGFDPVWSAYLHKSMINILKPTFHSDLFGGTKSVKRRGQHVSKYGTPLVLVPSEIIRFILNSSNM